LLVTLNAEEAFPTNLVRNVYNIVTYRVKSKKCDFSYDRIVVFLLAPCSRLYRLLIPLPLSFNSVSATELVQCNETAVSEEFGRA
jgi:hypothetical protein